MRLLAILFWVALAVLVVHVLTRALRPRLRLGRPSDALDELVKDPVCLTYVVRSRAVRRDGADGPRYFCSAECAARAGRD
ncbi:MAG: hypothetical protein ACRELS_03140 [Candidatus Rokuibacteriota bacterium]